jgi:curved DNA-binding protein CbpA
MKLIDYYEFLQISPKAESSTIQRVYRYLASRFHPDNPDTGDAEKFMLLREAYDVLSDPQRRAEYDAAYKKQAEEPAAPLSSSIDFMDNMDGELNRRLAVLALLYAQRRVNPYVPEVSLGEIEGRMGFPRDYLAFTLWYLRNKNYIILGDNSDAALTAAGVDFVEANRANIPVLHKLLTGGTDTSPTSSMDPTKPLSPSGDPLIVGAAPGAVKRIGPKKDD